MRNIEVIFKEGVEPVNSPRYLTFSIDDRNRVRWQTLPVGEEGISVSFGKLEEAQAFVDRYADRRGFKNKIAEVCLEGGG